MTTQTTIPGAESVDPGRVSPGLALRQAREARGLTIQQVAAELRLTPLQVSAIEAEAWDQLPGLTFVRGFVRNYARAVGIDVQPLLHSLQPPKSAQTQELLPYSNAEGDMPAEGDEHGWRRILPAAGLAAGLFAVVMLGSYFDWFKKQEEQVDPPVAAPVAESAQAAAAATAPAAQTVVEEKKEVSVPAEPVVNPAPVAAPAAPAVTVAPSAPVATSMVPGQAQLAFDCAGDAWVEVRDASGTLLLSQLMRTGTRQEVAGKGPFNVVVGNAAKVSMTLNGKPVVLETQPGRTVARMTVN